MDAVTWEAHLASYAGMWQGCPDVRVSAHPRMPAGESLVREPGGVPVEVNCYREGDADAPQNREQYWVLSRSGRLLVSGEMPDVIAVVGAIHVGLSMLLPQRDALLLHAAAVVVGGQAILFAGRSRSGKTTASSRVPNAVRLAEDRCVAFRRQGRWMAASVPSWPGKYRPQQSLEAPIGAFVFVEKSRPLAVRQISRSRSVALLGQSVVQAPGVPAAAEQVLNLAAAAASDCRFLELSYALSDDFWPLLADALGLETAERTGTVACSTSCLEREADR